MRQQPNNTITLTRLGQYNINIFNFQIKSLKTS